MHIGPTPRAFDQCNAQEKTESVTNRNIAPGTYDAPVEAIDNAFPNAAPVMAGFAFTVTGP